MPRDSLGSRGVEEARQPTDLLEISRNQHILDQGGNERSEDRLVLGARNVLKVHDKLRLDCNHCLELLIVLGVKVLDAFNLLEAQKILAMPGGLSIDFLDFLSGIVVSCPLLPSLLHGRSEAYLIDEGLLGSVELYPEVVAQEEDFFARPGLRFLQRSASLVGTAASEVPSVPVASAGP